MQMPLPANLQMLLKNKGILTAAQANVLGISNERLRLLVRSGDLERVSHGVYISPDDHVDRMYIAQQRRRKIIYSHETALYLHELTDRDPISYTVTVPTGYNTKTLREAGLAVFAVKRELHELGAVQMETMFGNAVLAYGLERTICDCIRSRSQMDIAIVTDAVKRYSKRKDKHLDVLMQMAEEFRIVKPIRSYMEVLL
ncbi:MAG: type IV toxin-antitoxin system AbiEi family antitoxin domain-containing protein [Dethiobacter sp.]|nr:type IV toxin-antitoxin system AbiEi family antitoxin domain-containing protein [Dethiobacter sp.]MBS4054907.1 type IV toxin-antitoxin system AbiEi family antitoxin domain-containing protein [Thermaerobacter sp.]